MDIKKRYQFVVVGGGLSGICAAISAARHGLKTALIQDRPVLGGNASSEIRMHVCGADIHAYKPNVRETGIIEELLLTNRINNPQHSFCVQDYMFESVIRKEKNIDLFLNTRVLEANTENGKITSVTATQMTTEKNFEISADYFADATGNGFLGAVAGAEFMYGRESKEQFGEPNAPDYPDKQVMGASLMFSAKDMGKPTPFVKPDWAYSYTEEQLAMREHDEISSGYWWIEYNKEDMIGETENVRQELVKMLFGVWDHIKNTKGHNAENYALDWVGSLSGMRESRRLLGDYVLTENDLVSGKIFDDAVAYGGWSMDMHTAGGMVTLSETPTTHFATDDVYQIPYRCLYSKNISNLFLAGRAISVSHMAFGSTRVMATCAVVGQAVGTAAALCSEQGLTPRQLVKDIKRLQQTLVVDDCYIPAIPLERLGYESTAQISVSSVKDGYSERDLVGGYTRPCMGKENCWKSNGKSKDGEWITLKFDSKKPVGRTLIRFGSNLSDEITITLSESRIKGQRVFPSQIVKDYDVVFFADGKQVKSIQKRNNCLRFCDEKFEQIMVDEIKFICYSNYGNEDFTVFGVGVYAE